MRRLVFVAALIALALAAAPALAKFVVSLTVDPNKAGKGTTATLDSDTPKADQNPSAIVLRVKKGVKFDPRAVKAKCNRSQADADNCPGGSRIGGGKFSGTVTSDTGAFPPQKGSIPIDLFLAPPVQSGDLAGVVAHFKVSQTGQEGHVTGRVRKIDIGRFGLETIFDKLDKAVKVPAGFKVHLDHIHLAYGAHRKVTNKSGRKVRRDLIRNPKRCTTGSWPYDLIFRYPAEYGYQGSVACTS